LVNANKTKEYSKYLEKELDIYKGYVDSLALVITGKDLVIFKQQKLSEHQAKELAQSMEIGGDYEQQLEDERKIHNKDARRRFWKGFGIGLGAGLFTGALATTGVVLAVK
jgi:hypothetical protein